MAGFEIPIVLFIFKREKAVDVVRRIAAVKPKKLYILADQGRNDEEIKQAEICRKMVEKEITWDCELIKNYADDNRGVYENIGKGALWVLEREKWAIFLEDDNLPEISFFSFCKEMLEKYEKDTRILWICGTNYLGSYESPEKSSYVFTKHMLPCGWASWSDKFNKFYDGDLNLCDSPQVVRSIEKQYCNRAVYKQYKNNWMREYDRIRSGKRPISWDYQMDFSIKANNLLGICPCKNQIKNIGVDECSIHGGNSFDAEMTRRFCGMNSYELTFPLKHPDTVIPDPMFENKIGEIILPPLLHRIKVSVAVYLRKSLKVPPDVSIRDFLEGKYVKIKGSK